MTWAERFAADPTLATFVSAEIARAGIEVDTLHYQRDYLRRDVDTLTRQLEAAHAELRVLRRRVGRTHTQPRLELACGEDEP